MAWLFRSQSQQKPKEKPDPVSQTKQAAQQRRGTLQANERQNAFYDQQRIELPPNFAQDLMDLEIEVELPSVTIETITRLLQLYQQGVEYFSSIKSEKYLVFKNKSQSLLLKTNVQEVLNQPKEVEVEHHERSQKRAHSAIKQKEFDNNLKQQDAKEQVQVFLNSHRSEMEKITNLIENDITVQQKRLQDRIGKRMKDPTKVQFVMSKSNSLQILKKAANPTEEAIGNGNRETENTESSEDHQIEKVQPLENIPEVQEFEEKKNEGTQIPQAQRQSQTQSLHQPRILDKMSLKEQKIRNLVNSNQQLQKQKSELLEKNSILPF